jgi:amino acid transporter
MIKQLRHFENFHIILWLIKDSCWLFHFKVGGVIMVIPTIAMAFFIAYKTKDYMQLLLPNIAVCCWISANAVWMLGEFFDFNHIWYAFSFFLTGIVVIVFYFLKYRKHEDPV